MRTFIRFSLLIVIGSLACSQPQPQPQEPMPMAAPDAAPREDIPVATPFEPEAATRELAGLLAKREFARVTEQFDDRMKAALTSAKLEEVWTGLTTQVGPFKEMKQARIEDAPPHKVVLLPLEFERGALALKATWDEQGKLTGLFFVPAETQSDERLPPYVVKDAFRELDIMVGEGEWAVPGTLSIPVGDGPFPALVLVHGSGPHDRDETIGGNRPFRDLAWGLASRGVAVVRYDKRTRLHGTRMSGPFTVKEETVDDALAAAALLRKTEKIDPKRVFVLGHSLGGLLGPRIAEADPKLAGLVVLAGSARPITDSILDQMTYLTALDGLVSPEEQQQIDQVKAELAKIGDKKLAMDTMVMGAPLAYWRDLAAYDPVATAAKRKLPMLILHGGRDYQVTEKDFERWNKALGKKKNVTLKVYPELNHLFMVGSGGPPSPQEYAVPGHVDPRVIDDIAIFVKP